MKVNAWVVSAILIINSCVAYAAGDIGPYIGGNVGLTSISSASFQREFTNGLVASGYTNVNANMDSKDLGYKLLGGFQFSQYFAAEAYYAYLGSYKLTFSASNPSTSGDAHYKPKVAGIDLMGRLPISSFQTGFVRVGYFREKVDATYSVNSITSSESSDWSTGYYKWGMGVEWKDEQGSEPRVRTEFEYYNSKTPISVLTIGLVGHF